MPFGRKKKEPKKETGLRYASTKAMLENPDTNQQTMGALLRQLQNTTATKPEAAQEQAASTSKNKEQASAKSQHKKDKREGKSHEHHKGDHKTSKNAQSHQDPSRNSTSRGEEGRDRREPEDATAMRAGGSERSAEPYRPVRASVNPQRNDDDDPRARLAEIDRELEELRRIRDFQQNNRTRSGERIYTTPSIIVTDPDGVVREPEPPQTRTRSASGRRHTSSPSESRTTSRQTSRSSVANPRDQNQPPRTSVQSEPNSRTASTPQQARVEDQTTPRNSVNREDQPQSRRTSERSGPNSVQASQPTQQANDLPQSRRTSERSGTNPETASTPQARNQTPRNSENQGDQQRKTSARSEQNPERASPSQQARVQNQTSPRNSVNRENQDPRRLSSRPQARFQNQDGDNRGDQDQSRRTSAPSGTNSRTQNQSERRSGSEQPKYQDHLKPSSMQVIRNPSDRDQSRNRPRQSSRDGSTANVDMADKNNAGNTSGSSQQPKNTSRQDGENAANAEQIRRHQCDCRTRRPRSKFAQLCSRIRFYIRNKLTELRLKYCSE